MVVVEMTGRGSSCIVCEMSLFPCHYKVGNMQSFTYSELFVEFIVNEIHKSPKHFVDSLKKSKKDNPRRIGMLTDMNQLPHSGTQRFSFPSYLFTYSTISALTCQNSENKKATRYANTGWLCISLQVVTCKRYNPRQVILYHGRWHLARCYFCTHF